jgi:MYXO-CTERM domain-containing protein
MTKDGAKTEAQAAPPPSESKRGGCAGCAASGASTNDVGALVALGLGLVLAARRRFAARRG